MIVRQGDVVMYLPRSTLKAGKALYYDIGRVCSVQGPFTTLRMMDGSMTAVYTRDIVCVCSTSANSDNAHNEGSNGDLPGLS